MQNDTPKPEVVITGSDAWKPSIEYVYMKTRRAEFHLKSAESQIRDWIKSKPYTIVEKDDRQRTQHIYIISRVAISEDIPLAVGDFLNCLRSALDQLAWGLVHLFPNTIPDEKVGGQIVFPICRSDESYETKRSLFDRSIHKALDSLQPNDRRNAMYTHHLWKLDKLWNIDKHRTIPVNCGNWIIELQQGGMKGMIEADPVNDCFVVAVPNLSRFYHRPPYVKPKVTPDILFGEHMGKLDVSIRDLRDIYKFVIGEVIPKFAGFFPDCIGT